MKYQEMKNFTLVTVGLDFNPLEVKFTHMRSDWTKHQETRILSFHDFFPSLLMFNLILRGLKLILRNKIILFHFAWSGLF